MRARQLKGQNSIYFLIFNILNCGVFCCFNFKAENPIHKNVRNHSFIAQSFRHSQYSVKEQFFFSSNKFCLITLSKFNILIIYLLGLTFNAR